MTLAHVGQVAVFYEPIQGQRTKVGRLALSKRQLLFEYDSAFLATKLELSPYKLRLGPGVRAGEPAILDGLMGVFDDSLPDGWGKLLIDRRAVELGMSGTSLTPLDRLVLVGARSIGALVYEPEVALDDPTVVKLSELAKEVEAVLEDASGANLERLIAIGGSPQGARPKILVQLAPGGAVHFGARQIMPGFTAWLVKFPAKVDDPHAASLEHAYFLMAKAAGLTVPRTQLLGRTRRTPGYFAIERFDRRGAERLHTHTLGGLHHLPHGYPGLDYRDLLRTTRELTRDERAVAEMFRRACFNVFAHNRDDHSRNFAFVMDGTGTWSPSPAYDLTFSRGPGGEHTMVVAGEGRAPTEAHLLQLAEDAELKNAAKYLSKVKRAVGAFGDFAEAAGVPANLRKQVAKELSVLGGHR
jgi:serine/threonine-protein kinase HipA